MGISYPPGRLAGAALGLVTLAAIGADVFSFIEGPVPQGAVVAAGLGRCMVLPALFLVFGWLMAGSRRGIGGLEWQMLVPTMLAIFGLYALARFAMATPWSANGGPGVALLFSPASSVAALPGIALLLALSPTLLKIRPPLLLGFGIGLSLAHVTTGIAAIDVAAGGALFFFIGLRSAAMIDRILVAIDQERTAALVSAAILGGIGFVAVKANLAAGLLLSPLLGLAGCAIALISTSLLQSDARPLLARVGRRWLVLMIGLGVPLGLIDGHASSHVGLTLAALGLAAAGLAGLSRLADDHAPRRSIRALFRLRQAAIAAA